PKAAPPMMPAAATGAATKRMMLRDMVAFILSFPLRVGVWCCPHRCRLRTVAGELVIAPKLRIRPHRVAVVLTTRVTGDLRLLRILAIDSQPSSVPPGKISCTSTTAAINQDGVHPSGDPLLRIVDEPLDVLGAL